MRRMGRFSSIVLLVVTSCVSEQRLSAAGPASFTMGQTKARKNKAPEEALATFSGIVRSIDGKILKLDSGEGEPLDFNISRKTRYYDGAREIKRNALKTGDHVTVEARPMPDGKPDAVTIRLDHTTGHKEP